MCSKARCSKARVPTIAFAALLQKNSSMNILVVDAFGLNDDGRRRFKDFHDMIVKGFDKHWVHGKSVHVKRYLCVCARARAHACTSQLD